MAEMFQTFEATTTPDQGPPRLAALRDAMMSAGADVFLVPRADLHQGEYVADRDARLSWLTGFTGSAGFCAVMADKAAIFVDGRYRVQVRGQVDACFTPIDWPEVSLASWLKDTAPAGAKVAFDPWLHTVTEIKDLTSALPGMTLKPTDNLIDSVWSDQPDSPRAPFFAQPEPLSGEAHSTKRARLAGAMTVDAVVLTLPDSIAWLLNIRGADIPRNPVPHCLALLHKDGRVTLYCVPGKADAIRDHLGPDVAEKDIASFQGDLAALTGRIQIDPKSCPEAVRLALATGTAEVILAQDPCARPKARKNPAELAGARKAQERDAVAMAHFLAWLDATAPLGGLTEIDVVKKLEGFRRDTGALRDISFDTICGAGAHGAIVHYRVSHDTNAPVEIDNLLLVDSGGQYADGTTDITRTIAIGSPHPEHRRQYTRVLQGMIAISRARFPKGVEGRHLDALARAPLWMAGQDYDHGTGHGIGSYLCVHEGPQALTRKSTTPLEPGMIVSNEPGYYREGAFGIRIENLIAVIPAPVLEGADDRDMLAFETLTHVPLDRRLIDADMLSVGERDWVDAYHRKTHGLILPHLGDAPQTAQWLDAACAPLT